MEAVFRMTNLFEEFILKIISSQWQRKINRKSYAAYRAIINDLEWPYAKFRAPGPGEVEP